MKLKYKNPALKLAKGLALLAMPLAVFAAFSCMQKPQAKGPAGYDLSAPEKYVLPKELTEISGLAFYKRNAGIIYAHEDETGKLYYFKFGDKALNHVKFGPKGDYEDIAISKEQVIILRSDGVLFTFPYSEVKAGAVTSVKINEGLLPKGEYEGLYADEKTGSLYVLCKNCNADKKEKHTSGYILKLAADGSVTPSGNFTVPTEEIGRIAGKKKFRLEPSALAKNIRTNEWYILSSVHKLLVVTDAGFKVKQTYPLNPAVYTQPEGIAFDSNNNLYISNEGALGSGTILKFTLKK